MSHPPLPHKSNQTLTVVLLYVIASDGDSGEVGTAKN